MNSLNKKSDTGGNTYEQEAITMEVSGKLRKKRYRNISTTREKRKRILKSSSSRAGLQLSSDNSGYIFSRLESEHKGALTSNIL